MSVVVMLAVGLVIGLIARLLMPGPDPAGLLVTVALGVAGAITAGVVGHEAGWYVSGQRAGILASVVGAVGLLALYRLMFASHFTSAPR